MYVEDDYHFMSMIVKSCFRLESGGEQHRAVWLKELLMWSHKAPI